ncbi:MAG: S41 family peptidase [Chryseolinea sp.]
MHDTTVNLGRAEVTITEDPAISAPVGSRLLFEPQFITHSFEASAVRLKEWDSFNGILLSINFADSSSHCIEGSGVMVAPGIALCATHVIKPNVEQIMQGKVGCVALGICKEHSLVWRIKKITFVPNSDLTILGMALACQLPPNSTFNMAAISTRTPMAGENLLLTGFRASAYSFPVAKRNESKFMEYAGNVLACNGPVMAIIFDLRTNAGGFAYYSKIIAGAFADGEHFIGTVQMRNGPQHNDFGEKTDEVTTKTGSEQFLKPVIVLTHRGTISEGEYLTMHMKSFAHVTHIGDSSAGDFGAAGIRRFLPNGWSYTFLLKCFCCRTEKVWMVLALFRIYM